MAFLFFDFETKGPDLGTCGTARYASDPRTSILMLAYAIDDEEPELWLPGMEFPEAVREHVASGGYSVAHNAAFDRYIWQYVGSDYDFPILKTTQVLCSMAQAQASNLPGSLDGAARKIGKTQKDSSGKSLIRMFCTLAGADPEDYPEEWQKFCNYALDDIRSMRDVWRSTRPLSIEEWRQYWASENINDRGFELDVPMCENAAQFYVMDKEIVAEEVKRLTDGVITAPSETKRINAYVFERLPGKLAQVMVTERDEDGTALKFTLRKDVLTMLIEDIHNSNLSVDEQLIEFLELLEHGRSSSALKFRKMADQQLDGRMHNSYVFNGGGQTGRYSSRGIQVHNLPRTRLDKEGEAYNLIAETEIDD